MPAATASRKTSRSSIASKTRSNPISDRFFVPGTHASGATVKLEGADARKIVTVLRKRSGDRVEIIDSGGTRFDASLIVDNRRVHARLETELAAVEESPLKVSVAQAMPKGQKMDFVVEKLTELGIAEILPFWCERSVAGDAGVSKLQRWRRLAQAAAQQCGRTTIPAVGDPLPFAEVVRGFSRYDVVLFAWEVADRVPLRERLPAFVRDAASALIVIGPEGGFSADEAAAAQDAGAQLLSLGARILRTETAALVLTAILNYLRETGDGSAAVV